MKLIITEAPGSTLVAEVDDYTGPVPRPGEYIVHPPLGDEPEDAHGFHNVMSVKVVTYGILARPEPGVGHFVGRPEPYVEISV
jgi:hypothetical protein